MSDSPESNDFFGIEYISSTNASSALSSRDEFEQENKPASRSLYTKSKEATSNGGEYLDQQFFPGLEKYEQRHEEVRDGKSKGHDSEQSEVFEEQYFTRHGIETQRIDLSNRNSTSREREPAHISRDKPDFKRKAITSADRRRPAKEPQVFSDEDDDAKPPTGIQQIRDLMTPIWRMSHAELLDHLLTRVIHNDAEVVAFDKPYGLPYSGTRSSERPQFDRFLQSIKAKVAPKCERLHVVRAPPKDESGVMVFAKSSLVQSELLEQIKNGESRQEYRVLVRGVLPPKPLVIDTPLIKKITDGNMKMFALKSNKQQGEIFHVKSECRTISCDRYVSHLAVFTSNEVGHQVRAHLGYANFPLIGDSKYVNTPGRPPKLPNYELGLLNINMNQTRKLPMVLHCKSVTYAPLKAADDPIRLFAPIPDHVNFILKRLRLLKRAVKL